jgi:hypothetical protein
MRFLEVVALAEAAWFALWILGCRAWDHWVEPQRAATAAWDRLAAEHRRRDRTVWLSPTT